MLALSTAGVAPCPVPLIFRAEVGDAARAVHAVARQHPDAVFILESGWSLTGLPTFGEPPEVHVVLPDPAKSRATAGVRVHTTERMPDVERLDGILVAAMPDLVVDGMRARHPAAGV